MVCRFLVLQEQPISALYSVLALYVVRGELVLVSSGVPPALGFVSHHLLYANRSPVLCGLVHLLLLL